VRTAQVATALVATALGAACLLTACGGGDQPAVATSNEPSPVAPGSTPSPDAAQRTDLLKRLGAVDPRLVADPDQAVRRSQLVCLDIQSGKDEGVVTASAAARLRAGGAPKLTTAQGEAIAEAVAETFCPVS